MAQIFSRAADTWFRVAMLVTLGGLIGVFIVALLLERSDYQTGRGWVVRQPVPFSHQHHAGALRIDCRYCHAGVEDSPRAGFPPTHTCMSCHSQLWTQADMLAPVRRSLEENRPLRWNRVVALPDYVYFQHDVHVRSGVGCVSCHGQVERMPLLHKAEPLSMSFCLDCHRDPAPRLRPPEAVTDMDWHTDEDRRQLGERLMRERHIDPARLTSCGVCHR
ncbi:cytochrome c3 family protein [Pseudomonas sp. RIT-PI-AD]|uniref:cytochrome c3 family protein n=1 Tax=Pseudomonas sp. RIT-PI-AD TaxID=3035294 RepID=UPI0021DB6253|nr:cytochrome c3 family protein [Pseudomonas sp. RIT-PI-AD]